MPLVQSSGSLNNGDQQNLTSSASKSSMTGPSSLNSSSNSNSSSGITIQTALPGSSSFVVGTRANQSVISDAPVTDPGGSTNKQVNRPTVRLCPSLSGARVCLCHGRFRLRLFARYIPYSTLIVLRGTWSPADSCIRLIEGSPLICRPLHSWSAVFGHHSLPLSSRMFFSQTNWPNKNRRKTDSLSAIWHIPLCDTRNKIGNYAAPRVIQSHTHARHICLPLDTPPELRSLPHSVGLHKIYGLALIRVVSMFLLAFVSWFRLI